MPEYRGYVIGEAQRTRSGGTPSYEVHRAEDCSSGDDHPPLHCAKARGLPSEAAARARIDRIADNPPWSRHGSQTQYTEGQR